MPTKEIINISFFKYMSFGFTASLFVTLGLRTMYSRTHEPTYLLVYDLLVEVVPLIFLVLMALPVFFYKLYRPKEEDDEHKSVRRRTAQKLHGISAGVIGNGVLWQYIFEKILTGAMQ